MINETKNVVFRPGNVAQYKSWHGDGESRSDTWLAGQPFETIRIG